MVAVVKQMRSPDRRWKSDRPCVSLWVFLDSGSFPGSAAEPAPQRWEIWPVTGTSELFYFSGKYYVHWLKIQSTKWCSLSTPPEGPRFCAQTQQSVVFLGAFSETFLYLFHVYIPFLRSSRCWALLWPASPWLSHLILLIRKWWLPEVESRA